MDLPPVSAPLPSSTIPSGSDKEALRKVARDFETAFLAETLSHIGLDASRGVGGAEAFSSFLNRAYAERLSERGGIGLSETFVRAMEQRAEEA